METIVPRVFSPPPGCFFLFGPRGTGKSTWIRASVPSAVIVNLLDPDTHRRYLARPERLRELVGARDEGSVIVIDEVQKVPELLDQVHALIETPGSLRYILTGSSTRKLKRAGVNLLAGRLQLCHMHPFMAVELGGDFSLSSALENGMIPLVHGARDRRATVRSYASLYVQEEVQAEGLVRKAGNFARFLEAVSFSHGAVLNVANVARECNVERKSVEGYLQVLEDLLIGARVPVFTRRARRALVTHPKFYYFDAGVFRAFRPCGPLDRPAEIDGAALEGLVWQHLRAWNDYGGGNHSVSYWQTRTGVEVDFVVYGPRGFWAVEVKNTAQLRLQDFKGLRSFHDEFPEATRVLLYRGEERLYRDGVHCIPCAEFLRELRPSDALPCRPAMR